MRVRRCWEGFEIEGLGEEGETARAELSAHLDDLDVQATRFEDRRDALQARMAARKS
jgi:acyl-[acyl-carrier-protein] desaturase